jgi:hypothetical protein
MADAVLELDPNGDGGLLGVLFAGGTWRVFGGVGKEGRKKERKQETKERLCSEKVEGGSGGRFLRDVMVTSLRSSGIDWRIPRFSRSKSLF